MSTRLKFGAYLPFIIVFVPGISFAEESKFTPIDVQPHANHKLADSFHEAVAGNDLGSLPQGEQTLEKVKFKIDEKYLQLAGTRLAKLPEKIEKIKVNHRCTKLHFLHATAFGGYGQQGDPLFVADGTRIGEYKIHFDDDTIETMPIEYGADVRDWWNWDESKQATRGKVAWTGENDYSKENGVKLRLYLSSWTNPKPEKKVARIDFISANNTVCSPFCIAISAEAK